MGDYKVSTVFRDVVIYAPCSQQQINLHALTVGFLIT